MTAGCFAAALISAVLPGSSEPAAAASKLCSASCRDVYGSCYKRSQNRDQCQLQWQRCLEQCRRKR
jgi:hypothetical protein